MYEQGRTFTEFISHYGLSRSEGLVLRYLSDAYRALRRTVPESMKTDELDEIVDWLGETVRQTDSSLLDEWDALTDPDAAQVAILSAQTSLLRRRSGLLRRPATEALCDVWKLSGSRRRLWEGSPEPSRKRP